jgi:hypothetical protein
VASTAATRAAIEVWVTAAGGGGTAVGVRAAVETGAGEGAVTSADLLEPAWESDPDASTCVFGVVRLVLLGHVRATTEADPTARVVRTARTAQR